MRRKRLEGEHAMTRFHKGASASLPIAAIAMAIFILPTTAAAFDLLYSFAGADGAYPYSGLISDNAGNVYGTTEQGGAYNYGTVFRVALDGTEIVLHDFTSADGAHPTGDLIKDQDGNFYGTAQGGGTSNVGTAFTLASDGTSFTVLHSFAGGPADGEGPQAGLLRRGGTFYGTTSGGGPNDYGTIFSLTQSGTETVLYNFTNTDGTYPTSSLIKRGSGYLYGTTVDGGAYGQGTVFRFGPDGTVTVAAFFWRGRRWRIPALPPSAPGPPFLRNDI
jgi:uncharacterized repeat protein (TIGR03803 family)